MDVQETGNHTGNPGISVLMSVYKNEKVSYFKEAMDSILNQTRLPEEIVLMEDGPLPDELEDCIKQYEAKHDILKVYRLKQNVQLGRALRKGAEICRYDLIARMDTDDISVPDRLETEYQYMTAHPETAVVAGWIEEFDDEASYLTIKKMPEENAAIQRYGRYRSPLNHVTVMIRRSDLMECGNYQHFPNLEDYHLWSRMMAAGKVFYCVPNVLVRVRTNTSMYDRRGGFSYFRRYLKLRKMQKDLGLLHGLEYIWSIIGTAGMTLVPSGVRAFLYRGILRR